LYNRVKQTAVLYCVILYFLKPLRVAEKILFSSSFWTGLENLDYIQRADPAVNLYFPFSFCWFYTYIVTLLWGGSDGSLDRVPKNDRWCRIREMGLMNFLIPELRYGAFYVVSDRSWLSGQRWKGEENPHLATSILC
jgi:hypothetical protein